MKIWEKDFSDDLIFRSSRSGGAGGQHVNKVSSRVQLFFDIAASNGLADEEKISVQSKLSNRLNKDGILLLDVQEERSQLTNREIAFEKLYSLLHQAIKKKKKRVKTKTPESVKQKRTESKKIHGRKKKLRSEKYSRDDE